MRASSRRQVRREINEKSKDIKDGEKLAKAMYIMVLAYRSGWLKSEMEKGLQEIV